MHAGRLPRAAGDAAPTRRVTSRIGAALAGLRVLVAEDHPTNRRVIELILEPLGVSLTMAEDGQEAVEPSGPAPSTWC